MSGLFRRLSSRRSDGPEGNEPRETAEPGAADAPATTPADPGGSASLLTDPSEPTSRPSPYTGPAAPARVPGGGDRATGRQAASDPPASDPAAPAAAPAAFGPAASELAGQMHVADLPAGLDPDELAAVPATSARRGRLRRRAGFLRAARELLLRDLGGFVYELHRTARDVEHEAQRRLRETKLARLSRVDAELHELEQRLDDVRRQVLVREPGVGGECPRCGELFGSDARYCAHCGLPLTESARREPAGAQQPEPAAAPAIATEPESPPAIAGRPTEEISPLGPDHPGARADFQWPRREDAEAAPGASRATTTRDVTAASGEPAAAAPEPPEIAPAAAHDDSVLTPLQRRP